MIISASQPAQYIGSSPENYSISFVNVLIFLVIGLGQTSDFIGTASLKNETATCFLFVSILSQFEGPSRIVAKGQLKLESSKHDQMISFAS